MIFAGLVSTYMKTILLVLIFFLGPFLSSKREWMLNLLMVYKNILGM